MYVYFQKTLKSHKHIDTNAHVEKKPSYVSFPLPSSTFAFYANFGTPRTIIYIWRNLKRSYKKKPKKIHNLVKTWNE